MTSGLWGTSPSPQRNEREYTRKREPSPEKPRYNPNVDEFGRAVATVPPLPLHSPTELADVPGGRRGSCRFRRLAIAFATVSHLSCDGPVRLTGRSMQQWFKIAICIASSQARVTSQKAVAIPQR